MKRFSYSDYEASCRSGGYNTARRYLSMLAPIFDRRKRVLDIGCGQGIFLQLLQSRGIPAIGVDSDESILNVARQNGAETIQADVLQYLNGTSEEFDGIFCSHLIEHFPFEQVADLLQAMCLRLCSGGVLVLVFPNPGSLNMQLNFFWRDPTHIRLYQRDLIVAVLAQYGMTIDTRYPEAIAWRWASLAEANPTRGLWNSVKRRIRSAIRYQLEIDSQLINQPEDVLIVARK